tara:strand:- start:624 stop:854 length:231 start_codon:yes stop_codon:yes gene_type:complete
MHDLVVTLAITVFYTVVLVGGFISTLWGVMSWSNHERSPLVATLFVIVGVALVVAWVFLLPDTSQFINSADPPLRR